MVGQNLMPMHFMIPRGDCDCSSFTPADLALTGWWRADYAGSPYAGTASLGTSGTETLTPTHEFSTCAAFLTGTPVNGFTPFASDGRGGFGTGVQSLAMSADGYLSNYLGVNAFSGWVLAKVQNHVGGGSVDSTIWQSEDGGSIVRFEVSFGGSDPNVQPNIIIHTTSGSQVQAVRNNKVVTNTYATVTYRWDGATLQIGVNEAPGVAVGPDPACSVAVGGDMVLTGTIYAGIWDTFFKFHPLNGEVLDTAFTDQILTDNDFCKILCYLRSRYALSLT